mmetsp:Transcript_17750/g.27442  ORF Transcript_17750/g.27442 Transcript_17750/m.27442 type:complete len:109 (+) Transcript_17750:210-536(+)
MLTVSKDASVEEIEEAYARLAKYFDPAITGDNSSSYLFEEIKLAYETLTDEERRAEYDEYLESVASGKNHGYKELDEEEVERRRRERGKKRYMEDFDFVNEDFYNMWR